MWQGGKMQYVTIAMAAESPSPVTLVIRLWHPARAVAVLPAWRVITPSWEWLLPPGRRTPVPVVAWLLAR